MAIPKKIHYCWFGGGDLPELANRCINSWREFCPDYEIIRWDESNTDLESCQFVREAFLAKKWAFISDYIRLKVVEEQGGIYLDIDVELLKTLDNFLDYQGFMGFEQTKPYLVATGLGFGAIPHHPVIQKMMSNYENTQFIKSDGSYNMEPCPKRDSAILIGLGLKLNNVRQSIDGIEIFPYEYFSPISMLGIENYTERTVSIHHFNASWLSGQSLVLARKKREMITRFGVYVGTFFGLFYLVRYALQTYGIKGTVRKIISKII
ncbi:glycosyltransferase family 32 protein [Edwardsiella tarda]|uniref:glycosyltransferase family 32 protein n=1 Tax=Edwardsiella tarda TaxID=636 RepID=UPI00351C774A